MKHQDLKKLNRPINDKFKAIKAQLEAEGIIDVVKRCDFSKKDCWWFVGLVRKHYGLNLSWFFPILVLFGVKGNYADCSKIGATAMLRIRFQSTPKKIILGMAIYPESTELDIREKFKMIKTEYRKLPSSKNSKKTPAKLIKLYDYVADLYDNVVIIEPRTGIGSVLELYRNTILKEFISEGQKVVKKISPITKEQVFAATLKQQGRSNKEIKELLRGKISHSVGSKELAKILRCGKHKMAKVREENIECG